MALPSFTAWLLAFSPGRESCSDAMADICLDASFSRSLPMQTTDRAAIGHLLASERNRREEEAILEAVQRWATGADEPA